MIEQKCNIIKKGNITMKKTFRLLVICFAFVLCMLPGLVACDPETIDNEDTSSQTTAENTQATDAATDPTVNPDKNPGTAPEETTAPAEDVTDNDEPGEDVTDPDEQVTDPVVDEGQTSAEEETDPAEPEVTVEGTRIAKSVNGDETLTLVLHQLSEADAEGIIKCSLVLYNAEEEIQNYVFIDFISNGKTLNVLSLKRTTWLEDHCVAYIANGDGSTPSYELTYTK